MLKLICQLVQKLKKDKKVETQDSSSHSDGNTFVVCSIYLFKYITSKCIDLSTKLHIMFQNYFANLANVVKVGYKSNAFAPLVWFNAVVQPFLFVPAFLSKNETIKVVLIIVASLLIVFSAIMYLVLFLKDPKLLQSENFRIEDKKLDLIAQKGSDISITPVNLTTPQTLIQGGNENA